MDAPSTTSPSTAWPRPTIALFVGAVGGALAVAFLAHWHLLAGLGAACLLLGVGAFLGAQWQRAFANLGARLAGCEQRNRLLADKEGRSNQERQRLTEEGQKSWDLLAVETATRLAAQQQAECEQGRLQLEGQQARALLDQVTAQARQRSQDLEQARARLAVLTEEVRVTRLELGETRSRLQEAQEKEQRLTQAEEKARADLHRAAEERRRQDHDLSQCQAQLQGVQETLDAREKRLDELGQEMARTVEQAKEAREWALLQAEEESTRAVLQAREECQQAARKAQVEADRTVQEAQDAAAAARRCLKDHVALLNLELRSPLQALVGFAELLDMEDLAGAPKHNVGQILKGARHLLDLLQKSLDANSAKP